MRNTLPLSVLLALPAAAQQYDFVLSGSSTTDLEAGVELALPGSLIGNYDEVVNPKGTLTRPDPFGSGNHAIPTDFGLDFLSDLSGVPSGTFGADLDPMGGTLSISDLNLDLLGGDDGSTSVVLGLQYKTFFTSQPTFLYPGGFPLDIPIASQAISDIVLVQNGPSLPVSLDSSGSLHTFVTLVPVELSFTLGGLLGDDLPVGPIPLALPLAGTLNKSGGGAQLQVGFDLSDSQVLSDPLPGFELTDIPFDLPTLNPDDPSHVLFSMGIDNLTLGVELAMTLDAAGTPECGWTAFCPSNVNSTGNAATLELTGSTSLGADDLRFVGQGLPTFQFAYLMMAREQTEIPFHRGSQGLLCLDMPVLKFTPHVVPTGAQGLFDLEVDFNHLPPGVGFQAGDVWSFQLWYRDQNPGTTTNMSTGIEVVFCE